MFRDPLTPRELDKRNEYLRVYRLARVVFRLTACDCGKRRYLHHDDPSTSHHTEKCAKFYAANMIWRASSLWLHPVISDYDDLEPVAPIRVESSRA